MHQKYKSEVPSTKNVWTYLFVSWLVCGYDPVRVHILTDA